MLVWGLYSYISGLNVLFEKINVLFINIFIVGFLKGNIEDNIYKLESNKK